MGDSPPGPIAGILPEYVTTSSDGELDLHAGAQRVIKAEVKDIGYSSESQSNDEVEMMKQQIEMEYKFPGKCEVASDGPLGDTVLYPSVGIRPGYYCMTHVTDVDSTDKTDNGDTDSGGEKGKGDRLRNNDVDFQSNRKELSSDPDWQNSPDIVKASPHQTGLLKDSLGDAQYPGLEEDNVGKNITCVPETPMCSLQPDSSPGDMKPMYQLLDISESDSAPESKEKKSVRYLIEHAEDLIKPQSPRHSGCSSPQKASLSPTSPISSISPSKQTQTDSCSTVESSCDASGEDNSDHEVFKYVKEEMSTGTDDAEDRTLFDSIINLDSATESAKNASNDDISSSPFHMPYVVDSPLLRKHTGDVSRRRSKKDRPWSVVGFRDVTVPKDIEHYQHTAASSESAINHLQSQSYTDPDSSPITSHFITSYSSSTFPRTARSRKHHHSQPSTGHTIFSNDSKTAKRNLRFPWSISTLSYHNIPKATQDNTTLTYTISKPRTSGTISPLSYSQTVASDGSPPRRPRHKPRHLRTQSNVEYKERQATLSRSSATESYDSAEAESESESTDEYLTAHMEVSTSEVDDMHNVSGSISEHSTWDNYQMVYPTASEDPGEELLTWEPQDYLEFDDDFALTTPKSIVSDVITSKPKSKLKFTKQGVACEDSDSDLEDFHHILDQSEHQLKLADQSLRKKRKDPMDTGLHPNPAKYEEILVTFETNIRCLETICKHLNTDDVTEADVQRVQDLMYQWEKLFALASERHAQTKTLFGLREKMAAMDNCTQDACDCLPYELFNSDDELKETIVHLKEKQVDLADQVVELQAVEKELMQFSALHPTICLDKYLKEADRIVQATAFTADKVREHVDNLENNWLVWVEYLESQQELDSLLAADRERLHTFLSQREFGSSITKKDVVKELETLQSNLSLYESKLSVLQAMRAKLTRTSNEAAQKSLLASLADLRNQLYVVSERCKHIYEDIDDNDELPMDQLPSPELGKLAMSAAALHEVWQAVSDTPSPMASDSELKAGSVKRAPPVSKHCLSWLRSLPVQVVALVLVAGLVCALDPDILEHLANFSLTITPELQYINGPPAV